VALADNGFAGFATVFDDGLAFVDDLRDDFLAGVTSER
jgi:hypothetical protein